MSVGALEHILVLAEDIDATREFYCSVVGLSVGERPSLAFPGYWLYAGGAASSCLHIADRRAYAAHAAGLGLSVPQRDTGSAGPVDHVAFTAGDWDELLARLERFRVPAVTNAVPAGPRQAFIGQRRNVSV